MRSLLLVSPMVLSVSLICYFCVWHLQVQTLVWDEEYSISSCLTSWQIGGMPFFQINGDYKIFLSSNNVLPKNLAPGFLASGARVCPPELLPLKAKWRRSVNTPWGKGTLLNELLQLETFSLLSLLKHFCIKAKQHWSMHHFHELSKYVLFLLVLFNTWYRCKHVCHCVTVKSKPAFNFKSFFFDLTHEKWQMYKT